MKKREEGFIDVQGGKVWYEIVGKKTVVPLIALHGGPGYPHDSPEPLEDLANERKVLFYDQLGCGNSQRTEDKSLWTVNHFLRELREIVKKLEVKQYHILGHSWGAALGVAFALTKPRGLKSLILADPYISTPHWEKDAKRLLKQLPKAMQSSLKKGKTKSKEYKKASEEFDATGTLKKFDLSNRLHELEVPTLLVCGRFDEATPESTDYFRTLIPNAKIKVFEKSAHMPHWTERKEYIKTIRSFLRAIQSY